MTQRELKTVEITLDENQMCILSTILAVYFNNNPFAKTRSDVREVIQILNNATREVLS